MRGISLTRRQINLGLLVFLAAVGGVQAIILLPKGNLASLAYGSGALVLSLLALAYWRGWEPARALTVLVTVALVALFLQEPYLATSQTMEILLPAVIALILTEPVWVAATGALVMALIALRTGGVSVYLEPDNLGTYIMIVGGLIFSRLAVDNAQRLADANAEAAQARAEVERRAAELAQRNDDLQRLVAENASQRAAISELSVPLLPVATHTLVLPLVGALDSARMLLVQERALAAVYERRAQVLIVDVTGLPIIDTQVARGLLELVHAVRLLGAQVTLVGIRGDVAQTLVALGLDLAGLAVDRDVQAALGRAWATEPRRIG